MSLVIRCDQCNTRFRLDEARIPERGARVRCSKCQHSFFVRRDDPAAPGGEGSSAAPAQEERAAGAAAPGSAAAPVAEPAPAAPETPPDGDSDEASSHADSASPPRPEPATPEPTPGSAGEPPARATTPDAAEAKAQDAAEGEWEFGETDVRFGPEARDPEPPEEEDALAAAAAAADRDQADGQPVPARSADAAVAPATSHTAAASEDPGPEGVVPIGDSIGGVDAGASGALDHDPLDLAADAPDPLAAGEPPPAPGPNEDSLAAVGDPSSWDLSSDNLEAPPAAPEPEALPPPPTPEAAAAPEPLFANSAGAGKGDLLPALGGDEFQYLDETSEAAGPGRSDWIAAAVGWPLVLMLVVFTAWSGLRPPPVASAPHSIAVGNGFEIAGLRSRILENAIGGPLLVVSGELRNPTGKRGALLSTLAIRLHDPSGGTLEGKRALASANLDERSLRLVDPAVLRAEQQRGARELALRKLSPGETVRFDAVFDELPARAVRFSFLEERVPLHVLGAVQGAEAETVAGPAGAGEPPTTPPSTALPSGE